MSEGQSYRRFLRRLPGRLDPARIITLHRLVDTYRLLLGGKMDSGDWGLLYRGVGLQVGRPREDMGHINVWETVKNDVSMLPRGFGGSFTRNQLVSEARKRGDPGILEAYLRLKRLGFIYEGRDGRQHVLSYREARKRASRLPSSRGALEEFMASSKSGWKRDDLLLEARIDRVGNLVPLEKLADDRLLDFLDASLKTRNRDNVKRIAESLAGRLPHLGSSSRGRLRRITRRYRRELEKAGVGSEVIEAFEGRRPPSLEGWKLYVKRFLESGNPGYLDMLGSESKDDVISVYVRRLLGGDMVGALDILSSNSRRLSAYELLLLLRLATRMGYTMPRFSIRRIMEKKARAGEVGRRRRFTSARRGRVDVRRSLFMLIRMNRGPLVFRVRPRVAKVSLAVDVSGSVAPYSVDVLLAASSFTGTVARVVIFSDRTIILDARSVLDRFDRILSSVEFGGYTDIASAVKEASRGVSRVVVISDLRHNVGGVERLFNVLRERIGRGVRFYFIGVGNVDRHMGKELERLGAKVVYFRGGEEELSKLLRIVGRMLS